jgi:isopentenyl phosphate kinase
VDGIFNCDPKIDKNAKVIKNITRENYEKINLCLSDSPVIDVTGGIKQTYIELIGAAKDGKIIQVIHFKNIKNALEGKPVGTIIDFNN